MSCNALLLPWNINRLSAGPQNAGRNRTETHQRTASCTYFWISFSPQSTSKAPRSRPSLEKLFCNSCHTRALHTKGNVETRRNVSVLHAGRTGAKLSFVLWRHWFTSECDRPPEAASLWFIVSSLCYHQYWFIPNMAVLYSFKPRGHSGAPYYSRRARDINIFVFPCSPRVECPSRWWISVISIFLSQHVLQIKISLLSNGNINIRLRWLFAEYVLTACVIVFTMLFCLTMGE